MPEFIEIKIRLTPKQAEILSYALTEAQDEGPSPNGWKSPQLEEVDSIVQAAIELAKNTKETP